MGNCQAAEAATVIIQHPGGKVERLYWPTSAADVMKTNPGHYVALVIVCVSDKEKKQESRAESTTAGAKVTRVKLLKPKDVLLLGQVYRLITSHEVSKALQARKGEKMKKMQHELGNEKSEQKEKYRNHHDKHYVAQQRQCDSRSDQVIKQEKDQKRSSSSGSSGTNTQPINRGRNWRPSLNSISEAMN